MIRMTWLGGVTVLCLGLANAGAQEKPTCPSSLVVSKRVVALPDADGVSKLSVRFEVLSEGEAKVIVSRPDQGFSKDLKVGEDVWIYDCLYRLAKKDKGLFLQKIGRFE